MYSYYHGNLVYRLPVSVASDTEIDYQFCPNYRANKSLLTSLHAPELVKILGKIFVKLKILDVNYKSLTVCKGLILC